MKILIVDFTDRALPAGSFVQRGRPTKKPDKLRMFVKSSEKISSDIKFEKPIHTLKEITRAKQRKRPTTTNSNSNIESNILVSKENKPVTDTVNNSSPSSQIKTKTFRTSISISELLNK